MSHPIVLRDLGKPEYGDEANDEAPRFVGRGNSICAWRGTCV